MRIIDVHSHCWLESGSSDLAPARELLSEMDRFGVEKSLILSTETNDQTLAITALDPVRLYPVASIDPMQDVGSGMRFIENNSSRIKAIKLYPGYGAFYPNEEACNPIY